MKWSHRLSEHNKQWKVLSARLHESVMQLERLNFSIQIFYRHLGHSGSVFSEAGPLTQQTVLCGGKLLSEAKCAMWHLDVLSRTFLRAYWRLKVSSARPFSKTLVQVVRSWPSVLIQSLGDCSWRSRGLPGGPCLRSEGDMSKKRSLHFQTVSETGAVAVLLLSMILLTWSE